MEVIAIAAVGKSWQWAVVKRTEGTTPGFESLQGSQHFIKDHQLICTPIILPGRGDAWSGWVELETPNSDEELEVMLESIDFISDVA